MHVKDVKVNVAIVIIVFKKYRLKTKLTVNHSNVKSYFERRNSMDFFVLVNLSLTMWE